VHHHFSQNRRASLRIAQGVPALSKAAQNHSRKKALETSAHHLILFTRYPTPGTTKTRLIPELGSEGAARIQRRMTEHVLSKAMDARSAHGPSIEVRYEGGSRSRMENWLGAGIRYTPQGSGHLGHRMGRALAEAFEKGAGAVVIIGSDIPGIDRHTIEKAFFALAHRSVVLGPASDGGYYLLGMRGDIPPAHRSRLLEGIPWGSGTVLSRTMDRAKRLNLAPWRLQTLRDVDRPGDLAVWDRALQTAAAGGTERISVVIPAVNEAKGIKGAIRSARSAAVEEILVVDGGSTDGTRDLAESAGARIIDGIPPRACQANQGAVEAAGDVLLFLHADTRLPENFAGGVRDALRPPSVSAGAFSLGIDPPHSGSRLVEAITNFRSRRFQLPYGDQALFFRARTFFGAGGFPRLPIMDDFELVRRLKKMGTVVTRPERVATSSRRWEKMGVVKTTMINQLVIAAFLWGIAPEKIARWYRRGRGV
jgi:uncharacterized protein